MRSRSRLVNYGPVIAEAATTVNDLEDSAGIRHRFIRGEVASEIWDGLTVQGQGSYLELVSSIVAVGWHPTGLKPLIVSTSFGTTKQFAEKLRIRNESGQ
jgi:hypothetical protein